MERHVMSEELKAVALHVARTLPIQGHIATEALGKAVGAFSMMEDFERDLCEAGIHNDSIFHPKDCLERSGIPERKGES